VLNKGFYNG